MNTLLKSLGLLVALAITSMLAGCDLYFGSHGHGDTWNYCGSDGYYQCRGDSCTWVSSTCPSGSGSGSSTGSGSGNECQTGADCAAGCYCQNGVCVEGGFCATDSDCGPGYHCNTDRSSCEPNPPGCKSDSDCTGGLFCDVPTGTCTAGSCAGAITCTTAEPVCPSGQVPLIFNGCYTGACQDTATCDLPPVCKNINDETNCLNRADCSAVYTGLNCTKPDGSACHAGDVSCTCQSFQFYSCADKGPAARLVPDAHGQMIDAGPLMLH